MRCKLCKWLSCMPSWAAITCAGRFTWHGSVRCPALKTCRGLCYMQAREVLQPSHAIRPSDACCSLQLCRCNKVHSSQPCPADSRTSASLTRVCFSPGWGTSARSRLAGAHTQTLIALQFDVQKHMPAAGHLSALKAFRHCAIAWHATYDQDIAQHPANSFHEKPSFVHLCTP